MTRDGGGDLALRAFAGLVGVHALVQVACFGSAVLGITLDRPAALAVLVSALALALLFASRFETAPASTASAKPETPPFYLVWTVRFWTAAALLWSLSLWARLWLLAFRRPTYDWDGLYYHVPAIHEWALRGRVAWLDGFPDVPFVNYPMGIEAHAFFTNQILRIDGLVDALNLWFWPLAFFAVVVTAGLLGVRGAFRWFAGALLAGVPVLVAQSVTSYVDPGSAACVMAAVTATLVLVFHEGGDPRWRSLLWGASVGLVLGSKGTGVVMVPVFALAALGGGLWREGFCRWPVWLRRVALGLSVTAAAGGYWYLRNAYHTGNPIHPIEVRLGARVIVPGYDASGMMTNQLPDWLAKYPPLVRVPVAWLQLDAPIHGYDSAGGLGYIWLLAGLPAVAILAGRTFRDRSFASRRELQLAFILIAVLLGVSPAAWWARFTPWIHVLALPCLVRVIQDLSSRRVFRRAALSLGILVAVFGLAVWESERTLALETETNRVARDGTGGKAYLSTRELLFPDMDRSEGFDRFFAASAIARSLWSRQGTLLGGSLALPLGRRRISLLPIEPSERDLDRIQEAGVEWVLWDVVRAGEIPSVLRGRASEEHQYARAPDVDFRAIRLRPPTALSSAER